MLLIDCPHCGPRDEVEFHYGGEAGVAYPADPHAVDDRAWAEFLFYRANPAGEFTERWQHSAGCRKWFHALRDTRSYEVLATAALGRPLHGERAADGAGTTADAAGTTTDGAGA